MGFKPSLVLFVCACCASGSVLGQGDFRVAAGTGVSQDFPMQWTLSPDEAHRALVMPTMTPESSRMRSFALSSSERLQLREQITKAAQDIYAEQRVSRESEGMVPTSP